MTLKKFEEMEKEWQHQPFDTPGSEGDPLCGWMGYFCGPCRRIKEMRKLKEADGDQKTTSP